MTRIIRETGARAHGLLEAPRPQQDLAGRSDMDSSAGMTGAITYAMQLRANPGGRWLGYDGVYLAAGTSSSRGGLPDTIRMVVCCY